jgi:hypothetical protein
VWCVDSPPAGLSAVDQFVGHGPAALSRTMCGVLGGP